MARFPMISIELDGKDYPVFYDKYHTACANIPCVQCGELHQIQIRKQAATLCYKCSNTQKERREKISKGLTGFQRSDEQKEKNRQITLSQHNHLTDEEKEHLRQIFKGRAPWNKGKELTEEDKLHKSEAQIKVWSNPEFREKQETIMHIANATIRPTYPEQIIEAVLNEFCPNEYKYVGDCKFIIRGYSPDFVNINGQKKIVEVFGTYWHSEKKTGRKEEVEVQKRIDLFTSFGYKTLVIWEHEINEKDLTNIIEKILEFNKEAV